MESTLASWRLRALALAERRLPALTRLRRPEALPIRLDRRRIYVVPTRFGFAFAALLFVMLIGALNYGNNAAVLFTCLIGSAAGASVFVGFRAMSDLVLARVDGKEVHAGEPLDLHFRFDPGARGRPSLRLRRDAYETAFALRADTTTDVVVRVVDDLRRGWFRPGRVRVWTDHPLGLFHIWSWLHPDVELLVYPALERPAPALPAGEGRLGEQPHAGASEEHAGLRDYRPSDPPRLIAWKASVRHDTLLVHDVERRSGESVVLDYASLGELDREARIRRLAAWAVGMEHAQRAYTLRLPHETLGPAVGEVHLRACLRELALMPGEDDRGHD